MGWSSGTRLIEKVINSVETIVKSDYEKERLFLLLIDNFMDQDWDNLDEVIGISPSFDKAAAKLFPEVFGGVE